MTYFAALANRRSIGKRMDDAVADVWQPMHDAVNGLTGLMKPCGSSTSRIPAGVVCDSFGMTHVVVACVARRPSRTHRRVADVGVALITAMNAVKAARAGMRVARSATAIPATKPSAIRSASPSRSPRIALPTVSFFRLRSAFPSPSRMSNWRVKRQRGSHRLLTRPDWPDYEFTFRDQDEIGPRMLARVAKRTGLSVAQQASVTRVTQPSGCVPATMGY